MKPGSLFLLDKHRAMVVPGEAVTEEGISISGGGYVVFYRGTLTEKQEQRMFRDCLRDAMNKVLSYGSEKAVKVANQWYQFLNSRTFNNG